MHPSFKPTSSRQTMHKQTPSELLYSMYVSQLLINLHIVPVYEINIQKECQRPPNVKKNQRIRGQGQTDEEIQRTIGHTLQRKSHLGILGIAQHQPQFPHSCERFVQSQDRSTYFLQQNRQTDCGNTVYKSLTDTGMWKLGLRPQSFSTATSVDMQGVFLFTVSSVT